MTGVRVRADLSSPLVLRSELNLDALLTWCVAGDSTPHDFHGAAAGWERINIPVLRVEHAGQACHISTDAQPVNPRHVAGGMTKRRDGVDIESLRKRVNLSGGPHRQQMKPVPYTVCDRVEWLAIGDPDAIHAMLIERCPIIGGLRAHGYGRVRGWRVFDFAGDAAKVLTNGAGELRRAVPADWCVGQPRVRMMMTCRPPYWDRRHEVLCVPPGQRVKLVDEVAGAC